MDTKLNDLLSPIRDPTKNWEVNIADALEEYLSKLEGLHLTFQNGCLSLNFAQAALIIQGSTSVYCKKVEYLCSLCQQMLHVISSERRIQQQTGEPCKEKDISFSSTVDDFCSLDDLKIQKGLELVEDENNYSNKRSSTLPFTPVMLIRLEEREKGHTLLLNVKGEVIGNKQDYHLNICELDDSGSLSFPMSSSRFITELTSPDFSNVPLESDDDDDCGPDIVADDDAFEARSYSPCPSNTDVHTEKDNFDVLTENDNLNVPTKKKNHSVPTEENTSVPTEDNNLNGPIEENNLNVHTKEDNSDIHIEKDSSKPRRKSLRHEALKAKRAAALKQKIDAKSKALEVSAVVAKPPPKRQPKRKLPAKFAANAGKPGKKKTNEETNLLSTLDEPLLNPALGFCCQSFYSNKSKCPRVILKVPSLDILDNMFWKGSENESTEKLAVPPESCEDGNEASHSDDDQNGCSSFPEIDDPIDSPRETNEQDDNTENISNPVCSSSATNNDELLAVSTSEELTHKGIESYLDSIAHYCQTNDLAKKVNEWEERIKPILKNESVREPFDIHAYESKVMEKFKDNNRKQTVSLSEICKGKQKWEVCRYFLASLQLANNCSIDISADDPANGDSMELTLISHKTH